MFKLSSLAGAVATILISISAHALVDKSMAAKLGTELTPMGADPSANADGSIPAWSGKWVGLPPGMNYTGSGSVYPDPYADEVPLYTITADNAEQYAALLNDGMLAMLKKYPNYKIPVYPTHRDFRYQDQVEQRTKWNVGNAQLVNGVDGMQKTTGGAPFPIPENGAHVIWNSRSTQPMPVADSLFDEVAVFADGKQQRFRTKLLIESPYAYSDHPIGKTAEQIGDIAAYVYYEVIEPKRKKGERVIVHEPLDQVKHDRKAWVYLPGMKRVKRAPDAGYDIPVGPGKLLTADDNMGFNGAMDRYEWSLVGKREMIVPYHNYKFDDPSVKYQDLLQAKAVNPDYMRYEKRRVWVVEASLKPGERHIYAKRRFYMDEDSWLIVATEAFDGRGELWRVGLQNTVYDYFLKGYIARAQANYDLQANAYVVVRLTNETRPSNYNMQAKGPDFYTPQNLRRMGR
ncbi:MAG: DUF1329 domain-containing protein [Pseudomonadales bacterium]|nr:DUF1329 domain-containing protein [Pseudomonadales bacterium]